MGDLLGINFLTAEMITFVVFWILLCTTIGLCVKRIPEGGAAVIERFRSYHRTADSGVTLVVPFIDRVLPVTDMRVQRLKSKPKTVQTKDGTNVLVTLTTVCRVTDAKKIVYEGDENYRAMMRERAERTLAGIFSDMTFDEAVTSTGDIKSELAATLRTGFGHLGVEIIEVDIEEMIVPSRK